ncbi:hypothetical protein J5X07_01405 [Actinomyces bowdenii]|uniref:hypothetical protein n=1 Tax=Actinomyces bowdenii TaxID=131109 RepID=UPI001ABC7BF7|nr:hypothetical protein [Actinomyces bowdenii]MBO3723701.1 hypothetical protein [Actinomyces bowdenii]
MSITVETGRRVLVLKEASVDMDQELADYLVAVTGSRQRPPYRHEPDVGECNDTIWSDHLARDLLIRLARVTVGVVADDPVRMLWPQNDPPRCGTTTRKSRGRRCARWRGAGRCAARRVRAPDPRSRPAPGSRSRLAMRDVVGPGHGAAGGI